MIKEIYYYIIIAKSGLFDRNYYLLTYPDVRKADMNPLWHFVRMGWREGRNPSSFFDTNYYLKANHDIQRSGINPLIHFIRYGQKEGKQVTPKSEVGRIPSELKISDLGHHQTIPIFSDILSGPSTKKNQSTALLNDMELSIPDDIKNLKAKIETKDITTYNVKVSIIIPTLNAGEDFELLLKMLRNQKGFKEIEIIIVDSGSIDKTLEIAKSYNTKIIEILPEEFSHSYSRNLGSEQATGDYLLFTVQDALPPTKTWLNRLMTVLQNEAVSAVSCAEIPRDNADLFYRVISWNHYKFLDVNNKDSIFSLPDEQNHINLRKNGQISDLACLIPSELFSQYKYRLSYAEDLDLGIRLIKDGRKIAFLGTTRIIHSHNRPAFYFMKRGYVDNLFLSDIFSDYVIPQLSFEDAAYDIAFAYNYINTQIYEKISELNFPLKPSNLESFIKQQLHLAETFTYPQKEQIKRNPYVSKELIAFFERLLDSAGYAQDGKIYDGTLAKALVGFINITFEYLQCTHDYINETLAEEIKHCIFKEISILSGTYLAHAYLNGSEKEKELMSPIHLILKKNV